MQHLEQDAGQLKVPLYQALRDATLGPRLRLEQERIGYAWLERFLERAGGRKLTLAGPAMAILLPGARQD